MSLFSFVLVCLGLILYTAFLCDDVNTINCVGKVLDQLGLWFVLADMLDIVSYKLMTAQMTS